MSFAFFIIAVLTLGSAIAAMSLRNLVHCALALAVTFGGLAAFYLQLDAQFAGFAQILVYIGAVAILVVMAILLTRGSEPPDDSFLAPGWIGGLLLAGVMFIVLGVTVVKSSALSRKLEMTAPTVTVRQIGDQLMGKYVLPLEVVGLLLTAAMIGAVIIALHERRDT